MVLFPGSTSERWTAHYISLDVIPRSRDNERELERAAALSYQQHQEMKDAGLSSIPVLHQNENLDWLRRYLDDGEPVVALGTFIKGRPAYPWFDCCFEVLEAYPEVKVHGLGISTPTVLHRHRNRWTSVDSSTWIFQSKVRQIPCPTFCDGKPDYELPYDTIGLGEHLNSKHIDLLGDAGRADLETYLAECGVTIEQCIDDIYSRQRVWIRFFNALATHSNVSIFFVSSHDKILRKQLVENGAYRHLLSHYYLKTKKTLQPYITGLL